MILQTDIELTQEHLEVLARKAAPYYIRTYPRKKWSQKEYKEAARLSIKNLVTESLTKEICEVKKIP